MGFLAPDSIGSGAGDRVTAGTVTRVEAALVYGHCKIHGRHGASFVMQTDAIAIAKLVSLSEAAKSRTGKARRQTGHIRVC